MEIIVSARHFTLTDAIRNFSETSVTGAFQDLALKVGTVKVALDIQKSIHSCTITAAVKNSSITASAETVGDMNKSIADAAEKLRVQAKKMIEKRHDHRDRETLKDLPVKDEEKKEE